MLTFVTGLGALVLLGLLILLVLWPNGSRVSKYGRLRCVAAALVFALCAASVAIGICELFWLAPPVHTTALAWVGWLTVGAVTASVLLVSFQRNNSAIPLSPTRRRALAGFGVIAVADLALAVVAKNRSARRPVPARTAIGTPMRTAVARVNGANIYYRTVGTGPTMVLLHGFPETGAAFDPVVDVLARTYRLLIPDLRGFGRSERTLAGYEKANVARDIKGLIDQLSISQAHIVGHDVGARVAFAFAAQFPEATKTLTLTETILEGLPRSELIQRLGWLLPPAKHFAVFANPESAQARFRGRERELVLWFMNSKSFAMEFAEADVADYVRSFKHDRGMWAAFKHYETLWHEDAAFNSALNVEPIADVPILALHGDHGGGMLLSDQMRSKGFRNVRSASIPNAGHWIFAENPDQVGRLLLVFAK